MRKFQLKTVLIVTVILAFILILCGALSAQPIYVPGNPTSYGQNVQRLKPWYVQHLPVYIGDTTLHTLDTSAQIRINDGKLQYHYGYWHTAGEGGGGSGTVLVDSVPGYPNYVTISNGIAVPDTVQYIADTTSGGGGGTASRWGIEDNVGLVDRNINMQYNELNVTGAKFSSIQANDVGFTKFAGYASDVIYAPEPLSQLFAGLTGVSNSYLNVYNDRFDYVIGTPSISDTIRTPSIGGYGMKYMPLSVNGNYADATGNITVSTGGGSTKFGQTGEDVLATSDRSFDINSNNFSITNGNFLTLNSSTVNIGGSNASISTSSGILLEIDIDNKINMSPSGVGISALNTIVSTGTLKFDIPSKGNIGDVLTSTGVDGEAAWTTPSVGTDNTFANTDLTFGANHSHDLATHTLTIHDGISGTTDYAGLTLGPNNAVLEAINSTGDNVGRLSIDNTTVTLQSNNDLSVSAPNTIVGAQSVSSMSMINYQPDSLKMSAVDLVGGDYTYMSLKKTGIYFESANGSGITPVNLNVQSLPSATTSNVIYYNTTTGALTYGAAPGGGGTTETASNGLNKVVNDIQLGGPATQSNTIDWGSYSFTNTFNSLNNGTGLYITSNSNGATTSTQNLIYAELSGANTNPTLTSYTAKIVNSKTNLAFPVALQLDAGTASGGTALYIPNGKILVGGAMASINYRAQITSTGNDGGMKIVAPGSGVGLDVSSSSGGNGITAGSTSSYGIYAASTSGIGSAGVSTSNYGVFGQSSSQTAIVGSSSTGKGMQLTISPNNGTGISTVAEFRREIGSGTSTAGIGGSIDMYVRSLNSTFVLANRLISKYTDVTSGAEISEFSIVGRDALTQPTLLRIGSKGDLTLPLIRTFANDAAADADATLLSKSVYLVTGNRTLFVKP